MRLAPQLELSSENPSVMSQLNMRPISVQSKQVMLANAEMMNQVGRLNKHTRRLNAKRYGGESKSGFSLADHLKVLERKFKNAQV